MRTLPDRIRHTLGFEIFGLLLMLPIVALFTDLEMHKVGALGVGFSIFTTLWNLVYNILFDKGMLKCTGLVAKQTKHRVIHAIGFELSLLAISLPVIAWFLNISLFAALMMDLGLAVFYLFYSFGYNWAYDKVFPLAATTPQGDTLALSH